MNIKSILRDLWLLTNFQNGWEMVRYLRNPKPVSQAILCNGKTILHPSKKLGLVESILELWYEQAYFPNDFYSPKSNDMIVDIGANVGMFTLQVAKKNPNCKIAAFEPLPDNFSCLSKNISNFSLQTATLHQYAISNNFRQDLIVESGNRSLDHQLVYQSDKHIIAPQSLPVSVIPVEAIFDIINCSKITLMKIDIEGAERDIFESISESTLKCIHSLAIEYHDHLRPGTHSLITEKLKSTHYVKTIPSNLTGCGLLFAVSQA